MTLSNERYFVPISLGNRFYSAARTRRLLQDFLLQGTESLVLICDSLREYSFLAKHMSKEEASKRARQEADNTLRMLKRVGYSHRPNIRLKFFSNYLEREDFLSFQRRFVEFINSEPAIVHQLDKLTAEWAHHHYKQVNNYVYDYQRRYIIEETAISVFITECEGYRTELYTDDSGLLVSTIYSQHSESLTAFLGHAKLERSFRSIKLPNST